MAKKVEATNGQKDLEQSKTGFKLVGTVKLTDNTFPAESESTKTKYISRRLNLGVEIDNGRVSYAEMFGGFHGNAPRDITVFNKPKDGEEKGSRMIVAWEDRLSLEDSVMNGVSDFSTITVALEKDSNGKLFYNRFLSAYDAIQYAEAHLKNGDKIKVKGKLTPNYYKGTTTLRKEITYIGLAKEDEKPEASGFVTVLVDDNSILKTRVKQDDELDIGAYIVAYTSKLNNVELKKNIAYPINLVLPLYSTVDDIGVRGKIKKVLEQTSVKGNAVNEVRFEVTFEEGVVVRQATLDDLDKDSRELVESGILTLDEAIGKVSVSGGRLNRVVITAPATKRETVGDKVQLRLDWEPAKYTKADIEFDIENYGTTPVDEVENSVEDLYMSDEAGVDVSSMLSDLGIAF